MWWRERKRATFDLIVCIHLYAWRRGQKEDEAWASFTQHCKTFLSSYKMTTRDDAAILHYGFTTFTFVCDPFHCSYLSVSLGVCVCGCVCVFVCVRVHVQLIPLTICQLIAWNVEATEWSQSVTRRHTGSLDKTCVMDRRVEDDRLHLFVPLLREKERERNYLFCLVSGQIFASPSHLSLCIASSCRGVLVVASSWEDEKNDPLSCLSVSSFYLTQWVTLIKILEYKSHFTVSLLGNRVPNLFDILASS